MALRAAAAEGLAASASYSITLRVQYRNKPGMLGRIASSIGEAGGDIGGVDLVRTSRATIVRDITIGARDDEHGRCILEALRSLSGITIRSASDPVFLAHVGGKIEIRNKTPVTGRGDLSRVCTHLAWPASAWPSSANRMRPGRSPLRRTPLPW